MNQVRVVVEYRSDLPAGVPALWEESAPTGCERVVTLYLRDDLPLALADHYRCQAVRSAWPEATFDAFTVTPTAQRVAAVA